MHCEFIDVESNVHATTGGSSGRRVFGLIGSVNLHDDLVTDLVDPPRGARLTLAEVAEAAGVSLSTVKRRQAQFPNAYKDRRGVWRVPVSDLPAAGLRLRSGSVVDHDEPATQQGDLAADLPDPSDLVHARAHIEQLVEQLNAERIRAAVAEAEVRRMTANLEDLRLSLRAIAGPRIAGEAPIMAESMPPPRPVMYQPPQETSEPPRERWAPAAPNLAPAPAVAEWSAEPAAPRRGLWARLRGS